MRQNPFNDIYISHVYKSPYDDPIFPLIIDIELTNHCNLNCKMCSRRIMKRDKGYMDKRLLLKIIKEATDFETGIRFIRWGEPILHPKFLEYCKIVKKNDLPLHITTNGLLLTDKIIKKLVSLKVDSIIISMQGSTKEEYEYMRENNEWDLLVNNVDKLINARDSKEKPYIAVTSTMTKRDKRDDIEKFKEFWGNKVDSVSVGITNMSRLEDTEEVREYTLCKEPLRKIGIDWDGKVTACCGDFDNLLTIGDANVRSIYEIWHYNDILDSIRVLLGYRCNKFLTLCNKCYPAYENLIN